MTWTLYQGDVLDKLKQLESESINCCVTSPPYWNLRDYGVEGQLGLEPTPEEYVVKMVEVFREVKRVLKKDGTLWLNLGDSYCSTAPGTMGDNIHIQGTLEATKRARKIMRPNTPNRLKPKDLVGIPWRVAFALQAEGWYLRSDIIWHKPNPMPESVTDRPTKAHEYIFLLSKSERYYYDAESIKEPSVYLGDNNGVGFGHGTDKETRERDRVRGSEVHTDKPNSGRRSGNKERKIDAPGRLNTHMGSSVPWEGNTRNKRTVWTVATKPFKEAHFATFPPDLIKPCILAGCPEGGTVLDPFAGAGTTLFVAEQIERNSIGIEINPDYCEITMVRMAGIEVNLFYK